jgi:hypothetical protein
MLKNVFSLPLMLSSVTYYTLNIINTICCYADKVIKYGGIKHGGINWLMVHNNFIVNAAKRLHPVSIVSMHLNTFYGFYNNAQ